MTDRHGYRPWLLSWLIVGTIAGTFQCVTARLDHETLTAIGWLVYTWAMLGYVLQEAQR